MSTPQSTPRRDHLQLLHWIPTGAHILDLGCASGDLLRLMQQQRHIHGIGVEQQVSKVQQALEAGLTVFHDTIENSLSDYPSQRFDVVILNQTLQMVTQPVTVLQEALRVGKRVIVGFPNFAHWPIRLQLLLSGRMPNSPTLPYTWFDTPNIHLFTIRDLAILCQELGIRQHRTAYDFIGHWSSTEPWPGAANWLAANALVELSRPD